MLKDINTSEIDKILKSEAESLKKDFDISKRKFAVFGYNTIFKKNTYKFIKKISKERALFPTMNPNLFGGLPSIFSCKPELRVKLNPGDAIFCFPNKTKNIKGDEDETIMKKYFKDRGKEPPERCLTLVMIVIKKIDLRHIPNDLSFKYCKEKKKRNITKYPDCEYISFDGDLKQVGDITAKFKNGIWEYAGDGEGPHLPEYIKSIQSINNSQCKYGKYLSNLTENEDPKYSKLGCLSLKCNYYRKECKMKSGNWKYDILFKWGLLGSLKKSIPLEFRSFYLGSKGWSFKKFKKEIGVDKKLDNVRWFKRDLLNEKGAGALNKLRIEHNIQ